MRLPYILPIVVAIVANRAAQSTDLLGTSSQPPVAAAPDAWVNAPRDAGQGDSGPEPDAGMSRDAEPGVDAGGGGDGDVWL
jgi:hypothetical protein